MNSNLFAIVPSSDQAEPSFPPDTATGSARPVRPGRFDLVVIAASAGGVEALGTVLSALPADFPVPIAIVQHRTATLPNLLAQVLGRRTRLTVKMAEQSESMRSGVVYIAPPDLHLSIRPDRTLFLSDGHRIRYVLSSANPLFTSAAEVLGARVLAVVLTGSGHDGTDGVQAVYNQGGTVLVQDETTSTIFAMPKSAIQTGCVTRVLPLGEIGSTLVRLVMSPDTETLRSENSPTGAA